MSEGHWSSPNGCHPDCPACEHGEKRDREKFIEVARNLYEDNDCDLEIDDDAKLSEVDEGGVTGAWVAAWVWVSDEEV